MSTDYKSLRLEKRSGVAEIVLTGPGKGNAMGPDFWREMPQLFNELDRDEETHAVMIRGEGGNFSYGLDLMAMAGDIGIGGVSSSNLLAAERTKFLDKVGEMQQACNRLADCRKPVIGAINGWCIGGGLDLISACDIRIASADAKFSLREAKIAIVADIGSLQRLPAIIGQGHTRELAFTGKDIDAARALRIGLVSDVYETPEALFEAARQMAAEIAANPPLVVQGIKQVMNYCADKSIADGLRYVGVWNSAFMHSLDLVEAITAFRERRKPEFKGQ
ncbi:MAG: crotonase/enoyl-CoA hydratase family protein [Acidobacteriota bacterium]|nr:crotonase/enoyl-CoA hydratase family protein [Acidobacteriota bacterium]